MTAVSLVEMAQRTRQAAAKLAVLSTAAKNQAIEAMAQALTAAATDILAANGIDCQQAQADGISLPLYNRLKLDETKLKGAIAGLRDVGQL
ncbi:MAG: gamma-glutamyl-phosphate reductase, partial [Desulfobacteraceae bacterium]|nr:gamma-glutamyl-phosphate reductase [Desulfobacteraceae bacterium]